MTPPKPRIWRNPATKLWHGHCMPCRLGFGSTFWPVVLIDVLGHLGTHMHSRETALWQVGEGRA